MDIALRELRYFIASADGGSFTQAAAVLFVSQAAVSRAVANLEDAVGERLLRRLPRGCELTVAGQQLLPHARRVLMEADRFNQFVETRQSVLRLGYAWAALGKHSARLQREWAARADGTLLALVRHNTPTAGLAEGLCDAAITRRVVQNDELDSVVVGRERRFVAFASDDPAWARRRLVTLGEFADRTVVIDPRSGTTDAELWADVEHQPNFAEVTDVDTWLDYIATGNGVGLTAESTAHHHPRPGITYRPVRDAPRLEVRLSWRRDARPAGLDALVNAVHDLYANDDR